LSKEEKAFAVELQEVCEKKTGEATPTSREI